MSSDVIDLSYSPPGAFQPGAPEIDRHQSWLRRVDRVRRTANALTPSSSADIDRNCAALMLARFDNCVIDAAFEAARLFGDPEVTASSFIVLLTDCSARAATEHPSS